MRRRIDVEGVDQRVGDVVARHGDRRRRGGLIGARGCADTCGERREVLRIAEVLDVVDGEQRRAAATTERESAAGVVHDVDIGELARRR